MTLLRSGWRVKYSTEFFSQFFKGKKSKLTYLTRSEKSLNLVVISLIIFFCEICLAKGPLEDDPMIIPLKNTYVFYALIGMNCVGAFGWIFRTWWGIYQKKTDRTQEVLETLVSRIESLTKDVQYLTLNAITRNDATNLIREEIEYVEEVRRR